jgi:hypothetical protein
VSPARRASCSCGQLRLVADGDSIRISMCHCLACQRRTGSVFGAQARFEASAVRTEGRWTEYRRLSDEGEERTYAFCPDCGSTLFYRLASLPDVIAVPVGAFADPTFPAPWVSVWGSSRHPWVSVPEDAERHD